MQNITKIWARYRQSPLSSIGLIALFSVLLMVPWPVGGPVRLFLGLHSPSTLAKMDWDWVFLQPSGGLVFTDLKLKARSGMVVSTPKAIVRFSLPRLLLLQTRVTDVYANQLLIQWELQDKSKDASIDYAALTETHIEELRGILDTLAPVLSTGATQVHSKRWTLLLGNDTLRLRSPLAVIAPSGKGWDLNLHTHQVALRSWPMPSSLAAQLRLDSIPEVESLNACWDGGCLDAEGNLGTRNTFSKLDMKLNGVPLAPFGAFALPSKSSWRGSALGEFHWEGRIAHPDTWTANGSVLLKKVQFIRWPFQQEGTFANFVPQLREKLAISRIEIPEFRLKDGKVKVDSLIAKSDDIETVGKGTWTFPERLDFRLTGTITGDLYEDLPKLTRLALKKAPEGGAFKSNLSGTFTWQAIIPDSEHYGTAFRNLFR